VHGPRKPSLLVITDIDAERLKRAAELVSPEEASRNGIDLHYVNSGQLDDPLARLLDLSGGQGYNDAFVFAPVAPVVEQADALLARDGCLNFFAGPPRSDFSARFNLYNVHYGSTHIVGTSGGNTDDMREALKLMAEHTVNPATMITHVGGITSAADTILTLDTIPGGKKLIYTQCDLPLTAVNDFAAKGKEDPFYATLADLCGRNKTWNLEAEAFLLENAPRFP
jgi:threonine dehydrogenase-like Zn-dependent dehydrogenase